MHIALYLNLIPDHWMNMLMPNALSKEQTWFKLPQKAFYNLNLDYHIVTLIRGGMMQMQDKHISE